MRFTRELSVQRQTTHSDRTRRNFVIVDGGGEVKEAVMEPAPSVVTILWDQQ
jgi:hypothetical protein